MKTYYVLRIASYLVRFVPPRVAYWLCSLIGSIVFSFNYKVRAAVLDNLRHVLPTSTHRQRRMVARRIVRNQVKNYYDVVRLPAMTAEQLEHSITVIGIEKLDKALERGKGVILLGAHLGNFSVVAQMGVVRGYKMSIVAEDIEPPKLYDYVNKLRGRFGLHMIKLGSSEVRTIYRILRNNEFLLLAVDRDVTDESVPVQFFDAPADLPPGPVALALRTGATLMSAHTRRRPDNTSIVYVHDPFDLERTGDKEVDLRVNMRKVMERVEQYIFEAPDQWVVLQRVWDREYTVVHAAVPAPDTTPATPTTASTFATPAFVGEVSQAHKTTLTTIGSLRVQAEIPQGSHDGKPTTNGHASPTSDDGDSPVAPPIEEVAP